MKFLMIFAVMAAVVLGAVTPAPAESLRERLQNRREGQQGEAGGTGGLRGFMGNKSRGETAALPAGAQVQKDISYGQHEKQKIDVYLPASPQNAPIIFMVHGGGWNRGDKSNPGVANNKAAYWLAKGYILVSANYRMIGDGANPYVQAQDVGRAIAYVQAQAATWGGDANRIVTMGHSAGAHLVGLLAVSPQIAFEQGAHPWRGTVMLDSGAVDVEALMRAPHAKLYDKPFGEDPALWRQTSLTAQLSDQAVPLMMVCSATRKDKPCAQAEGLAKLMLPRGLRAEILPENLNHGEINANLGKPGNYTDTVDRFITSVVMP